MDVCTGMIKKKGKVQLMSNIDEKRYFFDDIEQVIRYIQEKKENVGQLRLQKTLYLLYAYYGATYGQLLIQDESNQDESKSEIEYDYPKELFSAEFEAWRYGPVIHDVYVNDKNNKYADVDELKEFTPSNPFEEDVLLFLDDLIEQINDMSDFTLVDRTHQDNAWIKAYGDGGYRLKMNNNTIIQEYVDDYVS